MIGHGQKSSANQSMLVWELTLYKARFGFQNVILSLFFEDLQEVISNIPKASRKMKREDDDDIPLHGAINEEEAKHYSQNLDSIINKLGTNIRHEVPDAMNGAIQRYKETIATMVPGRQILTYLENG